MSTFTPNLNLQLQAVNENNGTWGTILNTNVITIIDNALGSAFAANVAGNSNITPTATQAGNLIHNLTGALTGNINYIFPASAGRFLVIKNATSGAFTVTVMPSGGTGIIIPQGTTQFIYIDPSAATAYQPITATGLGALIAANNLSDVKSLTSAFNNISPMTTAGDTIYGGTAGAATRLAAGTAGLFYQAQGTSAPVWASPLGRLLNIQTFSANGTYTPTPGTNSIVAMGIGGGGGGGGNGSGSTSGGTGGTTSLGTLLSLLGGNGSANTTTSPTQGGIGGTASTATIGFKGSSGTAGGVNFATTYDGIGGTGASGIFGAGAGLGGQGGNGTAAASNTGAGGGGASGAISVCHATGGGGAGAFGIVYATGITGTYSVAIGAAGTAGSSGSGGFAGAAGGSGIVIIYEYS